MTDGNESGNGYVPDEVLLARTEDEPRTKPDITRYEPAVVNGEFTVPRGGYVIIEHRASCLDGRWLDTRVYLVRRIDAVTGDLHLWDPIREQQALSNYVTGPKLGYDLRIPPRGCNPETLPLQERGRGRKRIGSAGGTGEGTAIARGRGDGER